MALGGKNCGGSKMSKQIFDDARILVCVGSGGVGKTTVAASLGVIAAKEGKKVLHDFLVKNLYDIINNDIVGLLKKLEEKKAEAEHRAAQNKLYKGQTLFNTFFCTDPEIHIPDSEEIDGDLLRELYILVTEASSQGYNFIQFRDGTCLELITQESKIVVKRVKKY